MDSLSLSDYSDRELLQALDEISGPSGQVTTGDLARHLGVTGSSAHSSVGVRMSWMRRFGVADFDPDERTWSLTDEGREIAFGRITQRAEKTLADMKMGTAVLATRALTERYRTAGASGRHMLRREFRRGTS